MGHVAKFWVFITHIRPNAVTDGANSKMSSAYNIIHVRTEHILQPTPVFYTTFIRSSM